MKELMSNTTKTLLSLARILKNYRLSHFPSLTQADDNEIHILGNGPSLKSDLVAGNFLFNNKKCMCVNDFAKSDYFETVKPVYYVLIDPDYWRQNSLSTLIRTREEVYTLINDKTTWDMALILPMHARSHYDWTQRFDNRKVRIHFFNAIPISGFKALNHFLYKYNFGMPHAQNVLVAAIFIAINAGYKNIFLHGADHSWHEDIAVNDENIVCYKNKHFYDETENVSLTPWEKGDISGVTWKMHELLSALAKMFEGYHYVKAYADYRYARVFNASHKSHIDAFQRITLRANYDDNH